MPGLFTIDALLRYVGGAVCHQQPERSFAVGGLTLPLCARCTGIYIAFLVMSLGLVILHRRRTRSDKKGLGLGGVVPVALCFLPLEVDGIGNALGLLHSPGWVRMLTGGAFGFGLAVFFVLILHIDIRKSAQPVLPGVNGAVLVGLGAVSALAMLGVYALSGMRGIPPAVSLVVGVVLTGGVFAALTLFVYMLITKIYGKQGRWFGFCACVAAGVYISAAGVIKAWL